MPGQPDLDARELSQRLRDYGLNTLAQVAALIMGAVFSTAALCFVAILQSPELQEIRLSIWIVGVLNCWLALTRILHAGLIHVRPSAAHLPLILAWGLLATINFALISDSIGGEHGWRHVYVVYAIMNVLALALAHVEAEAAAADRVHPSVKEVFERRIREFRGPLYATIPSAIISIGIYAVALLAMTEPDPWNWVLLGANAIAAVLLIAVIIGEMNSFHRYIIGVARANENDGAGVGSASDLDPPHTSSTNGTQLGE